MDSRPPGACLLAVSLLTVTASAQQVTYVDDNASLGGDGATWSTAYRYLQDALATALVGSEIRVAAGVYQPDLDELGNVTAGDRTATFRLIGVTLAGGYVGLDDLPNADDRDTDLYTTILTGDLAGDDAPGFRNRADNSLHVLTVAPAAADSVIDGVTITGGYADGADPHDAGGGVYVAGAAVTIHNAHLTENRAARGGAIHNGGGQLSLVASVLTGNEAGRWGGALDTYSGNSLLVNSILIGNRATGEGGAVHSDLTIVTVTNCTVAHNVAGNRGGGLFNYAGVLLVLTNDILWANRDASGLTEEAQVFNNASNSLVVNHTNVMGWTGVFGGVGNINENPLFVRDPDPGGDGQWNGIDDDYGDVHLQGESTCIDAGDNAADIDEVTPGVQPLPATDLDGQPRIAGPAVDLGAYEAIADTAPIPTASQWGVVIIGLALLAIGTIIIGRRTAASSPLSPRSSGISTVSSSTSAAMW